MDAKVKADIQAQEKPGPWFVLVELNHQADPDLRGSLFEEVDGIYRAETLAEANRVREFAEEFTNEWAWIAVKHHSEVEGEGFE